MGTYQIKDLEELSGIKAHTIRVWEQRYKIIQPKRTPTNIRYYNDEDVRLLLNVAYLCKHRYRISKISQMSYEEMVDNILAISKKGETVEYRVNDMIVAMLGFEVEKFEELLSCCIHDLGFENAMMQVILPFIKKTCILWLTRAINPGNEQFVSDLIRRKIILATEALATEKKRESKKFLVFLPENELHDLTLLFSDYLVKSRKHLSVYLGQSVHLADVTGAMEKTDPDFLLTSFPGHPSSENMVEHIQDLAEKFPEKKILVTGKRIISVHVHFPANVMHMEDFSELVSFLES